MTFSRRFTRSATFLHHWVWITIPRPGLTKPWIGSPGIGRQQRPKCTTMPSVPLIASGRPPRRGSPSAGARSSSPQEASRRATSGAMRLPSPMSASRSSSVARFISRSAACMRWGGTSWGSRDSSARAFFSRRRPSSTASPRCRPFSALRMVARALPVMTKFSQFGLGRPQGAVTTSTVWPLASGVLSGA